MEDKKCKKEEKESRAMTRPRLFGGDLLGLLADNNMPAINFKESRRAYKLEFSAPGFDKDDFTVEVDGNMLTVRGEDHKEIVDQDDAEVTVRQGFVSSSFTRSFTLPKDTDTEKIEARMRNGMLTVKIHKKEEVPQPVKKIKIE